MTLQVNIEISAAALGCIEALENAGFETWLVGGCVRDALLGRPVHDFDLATAAHWEQTEAALGAAGFAVHRTGTAHGTVTATLNGEVVEVTTFRTDGEYSDGRRPDSVAFTQSIQEDLARRDFTINAMAYHPVRGLLDPYRGQEDLQARIIRTVGEPTERFKEDGLRILRGCRFSSQLGFAIDPTTFEAMNSCKFMLAKVSVERTVHELDCLLLGENVRDALLTTGPVIGVVLPEIVATFNFDQHNPYHMYDVWEHTARAVSYTSPTRLARWSALFHDVGKPASFFMEGERGHFYGHPRISHNLAVGAMRRLKLSPSFADKVEKLVLIHDRLIEPNLRCVRKALAQLDGDVELFEALLDLKQADCRAQSPKSEPRLVAIEEIRKLLGQIVEEGEAFTVKMLAINGHDLINIGISPGPEVGQLLDAALNEVIEGSCPNEKEPLLAWVADQVA